jgi:hypothetical protein
MNCPKCGRNLALVGRIHNCSSQPTPVVHAPVTVVHADTPVVHANKSGEGRYSDAEKRRAYRREWMRRKRQLNRVPSDGSHPGSLTEKF